MYSKQSSLVSKFWQEGYVRHRVLLQHSWMSEWLWWGMMWSKYRIKILILWVLYQLFLTPVFLNSEIQTNISQRNIAPSAKLFSFIPYTLSMSEKDNRVGTNLWIELIFFTEMSSSDSYFFHDGKYRNIQWCNWYYTIKLYGVLDYAIR